jgi:hypothetical protein
MKGKEASVLADTGAVVARGLGGHNQVWTTSNTQSDMTRLEELPDDNKIRTNSNRTASAMTPEESSGS